MGEFRLIRLGEQIRDEIAAMIMAGEIKDPRVSTFLSINHVEITRDLGYAKVYVSGFMQDGSIAKGVKGLSSAAGFIQTKLSKKLRLRQFPKLSFIVDTSIKDGMKMVTMLTELEKSDNSSCETLSEE
ncbi:MAG: 30S ribosome-binding factor RbfA [Spirochaetales bacterium]